MTATLTTIFERARAYLAAMPPAIAGQNGHGQTFRGRLYPGEWLCP